MGLIQQMTALSPNAILERGYAIVTNQEGQTISHVSQISAGESLNVQVSDGDFDVRVNNGE